MERVLCRLDGAAARGAYATVAEFRYVADGGGASSWMVVAMPDPMSRQRGSVAGLRTVANTASTTSSIKMKSRTVRPSRGAVLLRVQEHSDVVTGFGEAARQRGTR